MPLTVKRVERATEQGRYCDGHGLYLEVRSPNNRQWLFRWERVERDAGGNTVLKPTGRAKTRERWIAIGPAHTFNLEEARERARELRKSLADGIDPLEAKARKRAAKAAEQVARELETAREITFGQAADRFFESKAAKWKNRKHAAQFHATLGTYVHPIIGSFPVASIDTPLILSVLNQSVPARKPGEAPQRFWLARAETASRVRRRMEWVLSWATVSGHRTGDNPAVWRGHLDQVLPARGDVSKTRGQPALPYAHLPRFMRELGQRDSISARALEFTILTAARTGETLGAVWDELDLEAKVWSIPADRMKAGKWKNGQPHRVPLSDKAAALLMSLPRERDYVFPGGREAKPLSNMALLKVIRTMNAGVSPPPWTDKDGRIAVPHGFRSAFRDWAGAETMHQRECIELALAHTPGGRTEMAYWRDDLFAKRARLMADWSRFCYGPSDPRVEADNVVPMVA